MEGSYEDSVPLPFLGKWADVLRQTDPDLSVSERTKHAEYLDAFAKTAKRDGYTLAAFKVEDGELKFRAAGWRDRQTDE